MPPVDQPVPVGQAPGRAAAPGFGDGGVGNRLQQRRCSRLLVDPVAHCPRRLARVAPDEGAIVEYGQGPVGEQAGVVLAAEGVRTGILQYLEAPGRGRAAQLPDDPAGALVDLEHRVQGPEGGDHRAANRLDRVPVDEVVALGRGLTRGHQRPVSAREMWSWLFQSQTSLPPGLTSCSSAFTTVASLEP